MKHTNYQIKVIIYTNESTKTNNKANVSTISASSTNKYSNRLKKQSLIANKNAQINLPQFDLLPPQPNPLMLNGQELERQVCLI